MIVQQASEAIDMNHYVYKIGISILASLLMTAAKAADIDAGKTQAATCIGCHGSSGISNNPMWPNLAGQTSAYLETQLKSFRSGTRNNPTMTGIAANLKEEDIPNLAAYFASLPSKSAGGDKELAQTGKAKAAMCMGCHGNNLQGNGQFPKLAGQHPKYLTKQLNDFKSSDRKAGSMNGVAKTLTDDDIKALSEYLGSL